MCSWTNPSTGKFKGIGGVVLPDEAIEEDDDPEDQVVYRYDRPSDLLGLYQQRHQAKGQGSAHGIISKEKRKPPQKSEKNLVPPSAVEEAAWASLTQADSHWRISSQHLRGKEQDDISYGHVDFTEELQANSSTLDKPATAGVQAELRDYPPRKSGWSEALEQLIGQEIEDRPAQTDLQGAQAPKTGEGHSRQTAVEPDAHAASTLGQSSILQTDRRSDYSSSSKGKPKQQNVQRFRINSLKVSHPVLKDGAPVPIAQRLQQLVDENSCQDTGPHQVRGSSHSAASLTIAEKFQFLVEDSKQFTGTNVRRQSPSRSRKSVASAQIRSAIQDDIVDFTDADGDDICVQASSRCFENLARRSRSARNVEKSQSAYKDEPLEDIDNDEIFSAQEPSTSKSVSVAPSTAPTSISERFRDALSSAPLETTNTNSFGLSARLQTVLLAQKSKQMFFTKSLQRKQQVENLALCLEVVIRGSIEEAQLTTCRCEVLRSPEDWDNESHHKHGVANGTEKPLSVDIIFSKISSALELQVGQVVRIHPPWQDVPRAGLASRLIICTFFCELLQ
ncbi:hypothetical protein MPTK1_7g00890 [Marchantia polymorpha subsp. ruderalis]|uniref:Uncharacterized protein n=2 Tax=Marchantia polymorpha TaxID=3197 RepID=A0AAF6BUV9_MARPO|nr:hypothetical protein MARPO_0046s0035 [Marchantia polymorpha]BBN15793.1 hypothetical protein Mp_7g00890 [Marchantia polymorpha subsp. ruderalis]|eukprot:PTQ39213.1 hypothetical protein MARPO_0046s0035 [Marchantia polymorpha]